MKNTKSIQFHNLIGHQIRRLRDARNITQNEFAAKLQRVGLDVSRSTLAKIEARLRHIHDSELLYFASALHVELKELFPFQAEGDSTYDHIEKYMHKRY